MSALARTVRVRRGVRDDLGQEKLIRGAIRENIEGGRKDYRLPVERGEGSEPARSWPGVGGKYPRLIVLADPGLGKSWLIRMETRRLCRDALFRHSQGDDIATLPIPVPVRCDQLVGKEGSLAEAAAGYLVAQKLLPERSRSGLQARIDAGGVVLLLDALDELATSEQYGQLKELLRSWQEQVGDKAHCVVTSRIAGYRGSPLIDAREVELLAFTPEEVTAAIAAWNLKPSVTAQVLARIKDPAVAGMTRVPLLLALLCSLAAELPAGQRLPETRGQLYERVLRWFLTAAHRADERSDRPELLAEQVDGLLEILAPVAFRFATRPTGWVDLMPAGQLWTAIRKAEPAFSERNRPVTEIVQELSIEAGILVPSGNPSAGRKPSYLFLHRTFAEYLVARHMAALETSEFLEVVEDHLWFDADWTEVIPLLAGLLDASSARRLICRLLDEIRDPFNYALLTAVRALAERTDLNVLLPPKDMQAMTGKVLALLDHPDTREATVELIAAIPKIPDSMINGLLDRLGDSDWQMRKIAATALATRTGSSVTQAFVTHLDDPSSAVREASALGLASRYDPQVTNALLAHLHDEDYPVRTAMVKALTRRYEPVVADALITDLINALPQVRPSIVEVLAEHSDPKVTDVLIAYLGDQTAGVRTAVAKALTQRGPEAIGALLSHIDSQDRYVRETVVKALKDQESSGVINAFLERLHDPDHFVWEAAVEALASYETSYVTDQLLTQLDDTGSSVPVAVVRALSHRDTPAVTKALLAHLNDPELDIRRAVVNALADRDIPIVTDAFLNHLNGPDTFLRPTVVRALARRDAPAVTKALLARLEDPDHNVRQAVVRGLTDRNEPGVTEALLIRLDDTDYYVKVEVVRALATRHTPDVTDALLTHLNGPDRAIASAAAEVLANRNTTAVTDALLAHFNGTDPYMRRAGARALANRDAPVVTDALLNRLDDPDNDVRQAVVEALANRDTPPVTDALLGCLGDRDDNVRQAVVEALANRDTPVVTEALLAHLNGTDWYMRQEAAAALAARDMPDDLIALAEQAQTLNPAAIQTAYKIAERLVDRVYLRIPKDTIVDVRSNLAWLTQAVQRITPT